MKQLNWYQIFGKSNIPDGRTVLPTDDIQIWLNCADIWDKTYTTLAEVLADTDTLLALITSNNAVDYMVRSTTWAVATALVPTMTSNTTPSGECISSGEGQARYATYKAFDNDLTTAWCDTYSTSTTKQRYIGYDFGADKSECIGAYSFVRYAENSKYSYPNSFKIQGSNDLSTWVDLISSTATGDKSEIFDNTTSYRAYRLFSQNWHLNGNSNDVAALTTLQFYSACITNNSTAMTLIGANNYASNTLLADATWCNAICNSEYFESVLNVKVPTMTSNTTPSGVVSSNSAYSGRPPYRAFDGNNSTTWNGNTAGSSGQTLDPAGWIQYQFTESVSIKRLSFLSYITTTKVVIEGSNDGVTYEAVATITDSIPKNVGGVFSFVNSNSYTRYRCTLSQKNDSGGTAMMAVVSEMQLYGRKDV